jgi:import inner membrane translocase subunit TIM22
MASRDAHDSNEILQNESPSSSPETSQQKQQQQQKKKEYSRLQPITPEQIAQEDLMNNCAVKTIVSGVMGSVLGVAFGVFMGAMDSAVSALA